MSDQEKRNLALVQSLYEATGSGNFDLAETFLSDDFFVSESPLLPFAGVYRGKTALRQLYTKVMGMMDVAGLELKGSTCGGDLVIYWVEFVFPSGKRADLAEMFRIRDGKVCEIRPCYFDPSIVTEAVKAKKRG
jgi:ketosteroid isomerase-like protein